MEPPISPNDVPDEEVERRLARADGAIGAAGHQVTNPVTRDLLRQKIRGEITSEEYVRRVIENGGGYSPASSPKQS
ncbi:MAG: antitoxin VbhA family protein [Mycetocola sp.]